MNQLRSILQSKVIRNNVFEKVREIHKVLFGDELCVYRVYTYNQIIDSKPLQSYIAYGINDMFINEMEQLIALHRSIKDNCDDDNKKIPLVTYFNQAIRHNNISIAKYLIQIANDHSDVVKLYDGEYKFHDPKSIQMMELVLLVVISRNFEMNGTMENSNNCPKMKFYPMRLGRDKDFRLYNPHLENVISMASILKVEIRIDELPWYFESTEFLKWIIKTNVFDLQSMDILYFAMIKNQLEYQPILIDILWDPDLSNLFFRDEIPTLESLKQLIEMYPTIEPCEGPHRSLFEIAFNSNHFLFYKDRNDEEGLQNYFNVLKWLLDSIPLLKNHSRWDDNMLDLKQDSYSPSSISFIPKELVTRVFQYNMIKVDDLIKSAVLADDVEYFKYIMDMTQSIYPSLEERIPKYMEDIISLGGFKIAKFIHQKYLVEMKLDIKFSTDSFTKLHHKMEGYMRPKYMRKFKQDDLNVVELYIPYWTVNEYLIKELVNMEIEGEFSCQFIELVIKTIPNHNWESITIDQLVKLPLSSIKCLIEVISIKVYSESLKVEDLLLLITISLDKFQFFWSILEIKYTPKEMATLLQNTSLLQEEWQLIPTDISSKKVQVIEFIVNSWGGLDSKICTTTFVSIRGLKYLLCNEIFGLANGVYQRLVKDMDNEVPTKIMTDYLNKYIDIYLMRSNSCPLRKYILTIHLPIPQIQSHIKRDKLIQVYHGSIRNGDIPVYNYFRNLIK